jgi:hypothetical protein
MSGPIDVAETFAGVECSGKIVTAVPGIDAPRLQA